MAQPRRLPSGLWQATVYLPTGKRVTRTDKLKSVVVDWAACAKADIKRARWQDTFGSKLTVAQWLEEFTANRVVKDETFRSNRQSVSHILPYLGDVELNALRPSTISAWIKALHDAGVGPSAQRKAFVHLRLALRTAVQNERLAVNVMREMKPPQPAPKPEDWYTPDEVTRILVQLVDPMRTEALLMAWCGLRWGECVGLRIQDVKRGSKSLVVVGKLNARGGWEEYPKTARSRRTVPVREQIFNLVLAQCGDRPEGELVFLTVRGKRPHRACNWGRSYKLALARAGVNHGSAHTLRHTCASWLAQDGVPLANIGQLLGHTTPSATARYAHLQPGYFTAIEESWARMTAVRDSCAVSSDTMVSHDKVDAS